jgi:hypothetical protein
MKRKTVKDKYSMKCLRKLFNFTNRSENHHMLPHYVYDFYRFATSPLNPTKFQNKTKLVCDCARTLARL